MQQNLSSCPRDFNNLFFIFNILLIIWEFDAYMPSILIMFILFLILAFKSHFAFFKFVSLRVQQSFILSGLFCSYRSFMVLHCLFCSWRPQLALSLFFTMILCCCSHIKQVYVLLLLDSSDFSSSVSLRLRLTYHLGYCHFCLRWLWHFPASLCTL